jgi:hypothetical protein
MNGVVPVRPGETACICSLCGVFSPDSRVSVEISNTSGFKGQTLPSTTYLSCFHLLHLPSPSPEPQLLFTSNCTDFALVCTAKHMCNSAFTPAALSNNHPLCTTSMTSVSSFSFPSAPIHHKAGLPMAPFNASFAARVPARPASMSLAKSTLRPSKHASQHFPHWA